MFKLSEACKVARGGGGGLKVLVVKPDSLGPLLVPTHVVKSGTQQTPYRLTSDLHKPDMASGHPSLCVPPLTYVK